MLRSWLCMALVLTVVGKASAQPDVLPSAVDIQLVQGTSPSQLLVQVKLHSTAPFGGIFSALTITIRYDAASGAALGAGTSFCSAWSAFPPSPVVVNDGIAYRTYNGFGLNRLEDSEFDGGCGLSLPVETWFTITSIPVGGDTCTAFTLGNDAFTEAQNRDYYISMAGINVTGDVIGGPVNGGTCVNDCLGVSGGPALPGTPCDDGNPNTNDDTWGNDCVCTGTAIVYDCPDLEANIGDACDDGNPNTADDVVTADCVCAGTLIYDCPDLEANIGDACDDGNPNTADDVVTANCVCAGTVVYDCPDLEANIGDTCNDNDSATVNDVITAACLCAGTSTVGIQEGYVNGAVSIGLIPNPTFTGQVRMHLEGLGQVQAVVVTVKGPEGRVVYQRMAQPVNGTLDQWVELPGHVAKGLYVVEVETRSTRYFQRLVVQ